MAGGPRGGIVGLLATEKSIIRLAAFDPTARQFPEPRVLPEPGEISVERMRQVVDILIEQHVVSKEDVVDPRDFRRHRQHVDIADDHRREAFAV